MKQKKYRQPIKYYYLPQPTYWPLIGSGGLFFLLVGIINIIHANWFGHYFLMIGAILFIYMLFGWFSEVINEDLRGLHSSQMERSYRWGMVWFIASEVAFFAVFFGALFYARIFSVPDLASGQTHAILWPQFKSAWPLFQNPNPQQFLGPLGTLSVWGIPLLNTFLLLSSACTLTAALWFLEQKRRLLMILGVLFTIILGLSFLAMQAHEYITAYTHLRLTLNSGIYGTTFFMLTGFHALHVSVGLIMLTVILIRCLKGHFQAHHHFAFEAATWYWHFVDVVWLFLFVFVYWL